MIKLKSAEYDVNTGISTAIIKTELGTFTGTTKLHEEDKDIVSNFAGCEYAEMRAIIKYAKAKIQEQRIKVKTLENAKLTIEQLKGYEKNSPESRQIRKLYFIELNKLNQYKERLEFLKSNLYTQMKDRRQKIKEILDKAATKN